MPHHGDDPTVPSHFVDVLKSLGVIGNFPEGKLNENDEGEIYFDVATNKGKILLNFGKPITWIGMDPEHAHQLAELLKEHADQAEEFLRRQDSLSR